MPMRSVLLMIPLVLFGACTQPAARDPETAATDPRIAKLVGEISEDRLRSLLTTLVNFGTRNTLSETTSTTRGIGAARQWIFDELTRSGPRLAVSFDTHVLGPQGRVTRRTEVRNVLAILPGRSARRIYVSAHYDSLNIGGQNNRPSTDPPLPDAQLDPKYDHNADAPGANDNGSGTVLTMELARVFAASGLDFDATLVFALWAGEEQGLFGATAHARALGAAKTTVDAVFNNDIVGNVRGLVGPADATTVRVYSAGPEDSPSRAVARYVEQLALDYVPGHTVRLMAREDRFNRGSDHQPFRQEGFPAIVFREMAENTGRQHSTLDTLEGVDIGYLRQNARVNAAAAAALALAPPAPALTGARGQLLLSREPSGADASLRWLPAPGAVGYRVHWRDTWSNDWQEHRDAGNVTHVSLPGLSIDNLVFGVSAVGAGGHESVIRAYVVPTRTLAPLAPAPPK
ncbi:MAG TPA: M28 family metallopeptidase [Vicinamibacterales bacterium]|nr:M28 family metallopeptidase [Vicinamibacterales bacterium]